MHPTTIFLEKMGAKQGCWNSTSSTTPIKVHHNTPFLTVTERGTLCQLRNLINRRNVSGKPKSDVNAAEDFVEVITIAHILTAVISYLEMSELSDISSSTIVSHDIWM